MTQNDPGPPTWLFALAQRSGLDRHTFMQLLGTGGAAAVLMACSGVRLPAEVEQNYRQEGYPSRKHSSQCSG